MEKGTFKVLVENDPSNPGIIFQSLSNTDEICPRLRNSIVGKTDEEFGFGIHNSSFIVKEPNKKTHCIPLTEVETRIAGRVLASRFILEDFRNGFRLCLASR